jgi:hypothetical protein
MVIAYQGRFQHDLAAAAKGRITSVGAIPAFPANQELDAPHGHSVHFAGVPIPYPVEVVLGGTALQCAQKKGRAMCSRGLRFAATRVKLRS